MPSRHRSREQALQVLFQWDQRRFPVDEAIEAYYGSLLREDEEFDVPPRRDKFMAELVRSAVARLEEIDDRIQKHSAHWRLDRMPAVDRNIIRLAVCELLLGGTPPAVVIDEALELARRFSGEESVPFVNGVLDAVKREMVSE
ncbi:MAG: transcription antitermination factor NusB [Acidobacteria bacterium]|nr:transcription antitermination factor NusB [Acidobacteriota bacterium]